MCCKACGLRWYGGKYLGKQDTRLAYETFGRVLWITRSMDEYNSYMGGKITYRILALWMGQS